MQHNLCKRSRIFWEALHWFFHRLQADFSPLRALKAVENTPSSACSFLFEVHGDNHSCRQSRELTDKRHSYKASPFGIKLLDLDSPTKVSRKIGARRFYPGLHQKGTNNLRLKQNRFALMVLPPCASRREIEHSGASRLLLCNQKHREGHPGAQILLNSSPR